MASISDDFPENTINPRTFIDQGNSNAPFIRVFNYDSDGTLLSTTDYDFDGNPYSATGPVIEQSISFDHGTLSGLGDDDHTQYHNDVRGDIRYYTKAQVDLEIDTDVAAHANLTNNPHSVTKAQVGLGSVPNVDATDRANHTGTQLSSTISDFTTAVQAAETTTSLSLASNILTFTDENGIVTNIDLSLYLDDTNLARITSGVLNPTTGVVTFTRDDSSTFTIDMSSLLDDQNASEVPVTPTGNLASTDVQAALEEHQIGIDNINTTTTNLQSQITTNDTDITNLQNEQTTQNTNISNNSGAISTIQSQQITQDSAIALNTAKVSADGSIDTHSDVDVTSVVPTLGDQLEWDGSNWVPKSIDNGFTIFPIWAEENAALAASGNYEWSFGNGATGFVGIPLGLDCELFALSLNANTFGTSVNIQAEINGTAAQSHNFTSNNEVVNFTAIPFSQGDLLSFMTNTSVGTTSNARICAWFRVKSTALFPTPDRSVVNNSGVAFTSGTFATIPGMSTTVSLSDTGTIDGTLTYSALRSGGVNSITDLRVVINGNNGQTFVDTLSTFNDTGAVSHSFGPLPAGTYTVLAEAQVDQPITITACQLAAVAVED